MIPEGAWAHLSHAPSRAFTHVSRTDDHLHGRRLTWLEAWPSAAC